MTPQCNPVFHYTKQPLLSPNSQVAVVSTSATKKAQKNDKKRSKTKIKCVIVGDKLIGKTSLAVSYSNDSFPSEYVPTAYDNYNGKSGFCLFSDRSTAIATTGSKRVLLFC
mgnify:CR=1 FL=1